MLFLFFIYSLSARALPVPAIDISNTSPLCTDIDNCRTLTDIIRSCLSTIFLCTWVAMHPNVPEPVTRKKGRWRRYLHKISRIFKHKVVLFIWALLVPEYILAWAIRQRLVARRIVKENGM